MLTIARHRTSAGSASSGFGTMLRDVDYVLRKLDWLRAEGIWPNGLRYLWTDAFGVVLYVSLYTETGEQRWLDAAERLVADVERVLGRRRGLRIGEAADRDGQYFHYLAMWLFALARLGDLKPEYRKRGIALARDIHPAFVVPGRGVIWKMQEDLSSPYPGYGLGSMDAYDGYVSYRTLDEDALAPEIAQMRDLMQRDWRTLDIEQDLGLGMMLWLAHFFPDEPWAEAQTRRSLRTLETIWVDPPGYFSRAPWLGDTKFAFTNYGVSLGLQAAGIWPGRVDRLNAFFEDWRSGDEYDREAITWVMACTSHLPGAFLTRGGETMIESDQARERSSAGAVVDGSAPRRKERG
ncbi:hypothetical protein [Mesorhizobium sp. M1295]|uniref:hypothetical protein n=1 Tax=Mesorhizobium sp. M1295 TaxID=2957076 RepID=UPI00333B56E6